VAEDGGFSAATHRLHISQSALSQTVNAIERQFGLKLLERSSTGVRTTHQQPAKKSAVRTNHCDGNAIALEVRKKR